MKYSGVILQIAALISVVSSELQNEAKTSRVRPRDASLSVASYYNSGMVLQMSPKRSQVWGHGAAGASITLNVDQEEQTTQVDDAGIWSIVLSPHDQGGPYTLTIKQDNNGEQESIVLEDIYFGDVWLCSGQSNMQMKMSDIYNASEEIADGLQYSDVRLFFASLVTADQEIEDLSSIETEWTRPTEDSLRTFSGLCFLYGKRLYDELKKPIGLLEVNWGGSIIEAWSSPRVLQTCNVPGINTTHSRAEKNDLSAIWNGMVHPMLKLTVRGAIWYQGENNYRHNADLYTCMFTEMIKDWRNSFHEGNNGDDPTFPFGFVQLGTHGYTVSDDWSWLRWHQTADKGHAPNELQPQSFMATAYDLTDDDSPLGSIHPRDKQTVAERLSMAGLTFVYGKNYPLQGPQVTNISQNTNEVTLTYDTQIKILNMDGFSVYCGDSHIDVPISSYSSNSVTVDLTSCPDAARLAYVWKETPCAYKQCAIYSDDQYNLPAATWIWDL